MVFLPNPKVFYQNHDGKYSLHLNFNDIDNSIVNSMRRSMISELQNVGVHYDDIDIESNNSALHNQFVSNRLSMIPLCVYDSSALNIVSIWDTNKAVRIYEFKNKSSLPNFKIDIENDKETRIKLNQTRPFDLEKETIINITTQDIEFDNYHSEVSTIDQFIKPDLISQEVCQRLDLNQNMYASINKLKVNSKGIGDEFKVRFHPSIGNGHDHTLYSGVGTVAYKQVQNQDALEHVFQLKLDKINKERHEKGLDVFTPEEQEEYQKEFNTLDAKRVVLTDSSGNPNVFSLNIEGIGGCLPIQIVKNSIDYLKWSLKDLCNCIFFNDKGFDIHSEKLSIKESQVIMDSYDIVIQRENHTLGNILSKYLQKLFTGENALVKKIFAYASYDVVHPLDTFMIVRLHINPNISLDKLKSVIQSTQSPGNDLLGLELDFSDKKLEKIFNLYFIKQVSYIIIKLLDSLQQQISTISQSHNLYQGVNNPRFLEYMDYDEEYLRKINEVISQPFDNNPLLTALSQADIYKN